MKIPMPQVQMNTCSRDRRSRSDSTTISRPGSTIPATRKVETPTRRVAPSSGQDKRTLNENLRSGRVEPARFVSAPDLRPQLGREVRGADFQLPAGPRANAV